MLTRAAIMAAIEGPPETIPINVPEWGGDVLVRLLSEAELESFAASTKTARSRFVGLAVCDEKGGRVFTDEDIDALSKTPGGFAALDRVWEAGAKFNGMLNEEPAKN